MTPRVPALPVLALALGCGTEVAGIPGDAVDTAASEGPVGGGESSPDLPGSGDDDWFDEDASPVLDLEITEASWDALVEEPFEYAPVMLTYEGEQHGPYGLRTKGQNSWRPIDEKAPLKLAFNRYDEAGEFRGLSKLTLNAMNEDPSMLRERLAYLVYRAAGVPAARCTHVQVRVNGEPYGLFANLEAVNRGLIGRWFDDDGGTAWEFSDADFRADLLDGFEVDFGDDDRAPLEAVADALLLVDPDDAIAAAGEFTDMAAFQRFWAAGAYVTHFDGYPYSEPGDDAHVYLDPASGLLHWLPHGLGETWAHPDNWVTWSKGLLATTCAASEDCVDGMWTQLRDIMDLAEAIDLLGSFDDVQAQIREATRADTRKAYTDAEVEAAQAAVHAMIEGRRAKLEDQD
jgi:hypothetical protein